MFKPKESMKWMHIDTQSAPNKYLIFLQTNEKKFPYAQADILS